MIVLLVTGEGGGSKGRRCPHSLLKLFWLSGLRAGWCDLSFDAKFEHNSKTSYIKKNSSCWVSGISTHRPYSANSDENVKCQCTSLGNEIHPNLPNSVFSGEQKKG